MHANPETPAPLAPATDWISTSRYGRGVSRGILVAMVFVAWGVKVSDIRQPGVVESALLLWILGWLPSLAAGIGFPFVWPAMGSSLSSVAPFARDRLARVPFLAECLVGGMLVVGGELFDGLFPRIGNSAVQVFAISDLIASAVGAFIAFLAHRLLRPRGRTVQRG